jgi:hypothetical protein
VPIVRVLDEHGFQVSKVIFVLLVGVHLDGVLSDVEAEIAGFVEEHTCGGFDSCAAYLLWYRARFEINSSSNEQSRWSCGVVFADGWDLRLYC